MDPARLQQGELRSEVMFKEDKKYHIDLKVRRGNFFCIFQITVFKQIVDPSSIFSSISTYIGN